MLRIQLINDYIGSKVLEIADPVDINSIEQTIKRSEEFGGVVFEIVLDLEFIKDGRDFIKAAYENDAGIDSIVIVNLYEYNPNSRPRWSLAYSGQINFNNYDLSETGVIVNVEQKGLQRKVLNMMEVEVDLETIESENGTALPVQATENIEYHSKKLLLQFKGEGTEEEFDFVSEGSGGGDNDTYIQFPLNASFDEIADRVDYPLGPSEFVPMDVLKYNWRVKVSGDHTINFEHLTALVVNTSLDPGSQWRLDCKLVYGKKNNYTTVVLFSEVHNEDEAFNVDINYTATIPLEAKDEIYVYWQSSAQFAININFRSYVFDGPLIVKSVLNIDAETIFPPTTIKTILIYEAIKRCVQYYSNQVDCFKSDLLGRTDLAYAIDGKYSLIGLTNGKRLRGSTDDNNKIFSSLKTLVQFVNTIACVDFGFETDASGVQRFVIEPKEYFFDKATTTVSLGRVYDVRKKLNSKRFYNQIEIGYSTEIDVGQINAVDEFNTLRKYSIPISNTKNSLTVTTEVITSGYLIENARRLSFTSEDGKHDDKNFAVVLIRDGENFKTKKDEGYQAITNVLYPETGYNYDISPAQIIQNWFKVLASGLIRSRSKVIKFSSGTVNYIMTTQKTDSMVAVSENQGHDLSLVEPIYDNEDYYFDAPTPNNVMALIRQNPYGVVEFQDKSGAVFEGLISSEGINYDRNKKTAFFNLMRVYRP